MYRTSCTLIAGALCMMTAVPAFADPPAEEMARQMGYSELIKHMELPKRHDPRAPLPKHRGGIEAVTAERLPADRKLLDAYMYQKAEHASMIPFLLSLQKKQPESPKISRKLALTCLQAGQPREALYWFTYTYQRDRSDLPALWNMAALAYRLGDTRKTTDYLDEYARRDPNSMWGIVAKKFLETGTFAGYDARSTIADHGMPRVGYVGGGAAGAKEGGLMVVEGKRVTPEEMLPEANQLPDVNPFKPGRKAGGEKTDDGTAAYRAATRAEAAAEAKIPTPMPGASLAKAEIQPPADEKASGAHVVAHLVASGAASAAPVAVATPAAPVGASASVAAHASSAAGAPVVASGAPVAAPGPVTAGGPVPPTPGK
ncbi:MAG TPA: hypothetical protein PLY73_13025 [Candidatus Ozemobacteraceae bacterium]|nr:hypothetical protein [Candidatus Ozemobacteraceae bacterium]